MRRVGQARRRDANEKAICEALRAAGATITKVSGVGAPDLLVRFRGRVYGLEVKGPKGKRTAAQRKSKWPVVRSATEALAKIGAAAHGESRRECHENARLEARRADDEYFRSGTRYPGQ